jgi:SAM-dependent methyltransferase
MDRMERMLAAFTPHLLAAARIDPGDRVADIGCGGGETTRQAARLATRGELLGVDVSQLLIDRARELTGASWRNIRFECADAQRHPFGDGSFDVLLSRFGIMFFDDPPAAFANLARALRPGGRLAFTCWQESSRDEYDSVILGTIAAHVPLPDVTGAAVSLADPGYAHRLLSGAGFAGIAVDPLDLPMRAARDAAEIVQYVQRVPSISAAFEEAGPEKTAIALDALRTALEPYATEGGVQLRGAAWLVTAGKT